MRYAFASPHVSPPPHIHTHKHTLTHARALRRTHTYKHTFKHTHTPNGCITFTDGSSAIAGLVCREEGGDLSSIFQCFQPASQLAWKCRIHGDYKTQLHKSTIKLLIWLTLMCGGWTWYVLNLARNGILTQLIHGNRSALRCRWIFNNHVCRAPRLTPETIHTKQEDQMLRRLAFKTIFFYFFISCDWKLLRTCNAKWRSSSWRVLKKTKNTYTTSEKFPIHMCMLLLLFRQRKQMSHLSL